MWERKKMEGVKSVVIHLFSTRCAVRSFFSPLRWNGKDSLISKTFKTVSQSVVLKFNYHLRHRINWSVVAVSRGRYSSSPSTKMELRTRRCKSVLASFHTDSWADLLWSRSVDESVDKNVKRTKFKESRKSRKRRESRRQFTLVRNHMFFFPVRRGELVMLPDVSRCSDWTGRIRRAKIIQQNVSSTLCRTYGSYGGRFGRCTWVGSRSDSYHRRTAPESAGSRTETTSVLI